MCSIGKRSDQPCSSLRPIQAHDKNPEVSGVLQGIKGQYLILDTGVINIRKFGSYEVEVSA